jgi:hypothetical protein
MQKKQLPKGMSPTAVLDPGGKPSTWFLPGGLVEQICVTRIEFMLFMYCTKCCKNGCERSCPHTRAHTHQSEKTQQQLIITTMRTYLISVVHEDSDESYKTSNSIQKTWTLMFIIKNTASVYKTCFKVEFFNINLGVTPACVKLFITLIYPNFQK